MTFFQLAWLFFIYSFLGWLGEVLATAVRQRRYLDRGVLGGPWCLIYGIFRRADHGRLPRTGRGGAGCSSCSCSARCWPPRLSGSAAISWSAPPTARWWDYSHRKFNLDGYICLQASILWGLLGVAAAMWVAPLLLTAFGLMPALLRQVIIWVLVGLLALDGIGTLLTLAGVRHVAPQAEGGGKNVHHRLSNITLRMGLWILARTESRMMRAYPQADLTRRKKEKSATFAPGASFYKLFLLFFIGSFLGDIVETIFCKLTMGEWMSRSSLVWGPFSVVWGMALALCTLLMYRYKDKTAGWLFVAGTLLGGAYEYLCSVLSELVFGAVFWDYSHIPFNLGGPCQPAVLLLLGLCGGGVVQNLLPAAFRLD